MKEIDPHQTKFPQGGWYFRYGNKGKWEPYDLETARALKEGGTGVLYGATFTLKKKLGRFYVYEDNFYGFSHSWRGW